MFGSLLVAAISLVTGVWIGTFYVAPLHYEQLNHLQYKPLLSPLDWMRTNGSTSTSTSSSTTSTGVQTSAAGSLLPPSPCDVILPPAPSITLSPPPAHPKPQPREQLSNAFYAIPPGGLPEVAETNAQPQQQQQQQSAPPPPPPPDPLTATTTTTTTALSNEASLTESLTVYLNEEPTDSLSYFFFSWSLLGGSTDADDYTGPGYALSSLSGRELDVSAFAVDADGDWVIRSQAGSSGSGRHSSDGSSSGGGGGGGSGSGGMSGASHHPHHPHHHHLHTHNRNPDPSTPSSSSSPYSTTGSSASAASSSPAAAHEDRLHQRLTLPYHQPHQTYHSHHHPPNPDGPDYHMFALHHYLSAHSELDHQNQLPLVPTLSDDPINSYHY